MDKVIIIGGIGTGTIIAQAIIDSERRGRDDIKLMGFMSHNKEVGEEIEGFPVFVKQSRENVERCYCDGYKFIFALHRMDGGDHFVELYNYLGLRSEMMATFVHPMAYVAPNVIVSNGAVIMPNAMISAATIIGENSLIMTGVTIGHNSVLGKFNHLASQSVVGSYVKTGVGTHFGLNCTVREYLAIGSFSTIGMGAVLTKNVEDYEIWVGNPAKFLRYTVTTCNSIGYSVKGVK